MNHLIECVLKVIFLAIFFEVIKAGHTNHTVKVYLFLSGFHIKHHYQVIFILCQLSVFELEQFIFPLC